MSTSNETMSNPVTNENPLINKLAQINEENKVTSNMFLKEIFLLTEEENLLAKCQKNLSEANKLKAGTILNKRKRPVRPSTTNDFLNDSLSSQFNLNADNSQTDTDDYVYEHLSKKHQQLKKYKILQQEKTNTEMSAIITDQEVSKQSDLVQNENKLIQIPESVPAAVGSRLNGPDSLGKKWKSLPEAAKNLMREWYDIHVLNPYPTEAERVDMSIKGNISENQVKAWFANKRNRASKKLDVAKLKNLKPDLSAVDLATTTDCELKATDTFVTKLVETVELTEEKPNNAKKPSQEVANTNNDESFKILDLSDIEKDDVIAKNNIPASCFKSYPTHKKLLPSLCNNKQHAVSNCNEPIIILDESTKPEVSNMKRKRPSKQPLIQPKPATTPNKTSSKILVKINPLNVSSITKVAGINKINAFNTQLPSKNRVQQCYMIKPKAYNNNFCNKPLRGAYESKQTSQHHQDTCGISMSKFKVEGDKNLPQPELLNHSQQYQPHFHHHHHQQQQQQIFWDNNQYCNSFCYQTKQPQYHSNYQSYPMSLMPAQSSISLIPFQNKQMANSFSLNENLVAFNNNSFYSNENPMYQTLYAKGMNQFQHQHYQTNVYQQPSQPYDSTCCYIVSAKPQANLAATSSANMSSNQNSNLFPQIMANNFHANFSENAFLCAESQAESVSNPNLPAADNLMAAAYHASSSPAPLTPSLPAMSSIFNQHQCDTPPPIMTKKTEDSSKKPNQELSDPKNKAAEGKETETSVPSTSNEPCNVTVINNGPIISNNKVFQQKYSYMTNAAAAPSDLKNNFNIYSNNLILNKGFTHINSNNINSINNSFATEGGQQQQQQLYKASLNGVVYNGDNTNCINYSPIFISNNASSNALDGTQPSFYSNLPHHMEPGNKPIDVKVNEPKTTNDFNQLCFLSSTPQFIYTKPHYAELNNSLGAYSTPNSSFSLSSTSSNDSKKCLNSFINHAATPMGKQHKSDDVILIESNDSIKAGLMLNEADFNKPKEWCVSHPHLSNTLLNLGLPNMQLNAASNSTFPLKN